MNEAAEVKDKNHFHVYGLKCWICQKLMACDCGECLLCGPPTTQADIEKVLAEIRQAARKRRYRRSKS